MEEVSKPLSSLQESFKLGVHHLEASRWSDAESVYRSHGGLQWPNNPDIHYNLGVALKNQRKLEEAYASFRQALTLKPNYAEVLINIGDTLGDMNRPAEAMEAYKRGLSLRPNFPEGWNNMGIMLRQANQPAEAVEAYRRALAQRGNFALAWNNLAGALKDVGQLDESVASYDRGIALAPQHWVMQGGRLCMLHFHPGYDAMAIYRESRQWNDRFARPLAGEIRAHDNERSPDRKLRIGYISPRFPPPLPDAVHVAFAAPSTIAARLRFTAIAAWPRSDTVTARIKAQTDAWRDISGITDQAAADLIRQDKIDILVEITLHMTGNRLRLLARKPAPIQVTWLGYPGTTGVDAIDYRLTDPRLDPPDLGNEENESGTASGACPHAQSAVSASGQDGRANQNTADSTAIRIAPLAVPLEPAAEQQLQALQIIALAPKNLTTPSEQFACPTHSGATTRVPPTRTPKPPTRNQAPCRRWRRGTSPSGV